MSESAAQRFDVETYIKHAPRRTPRFTEADLRIIAEHAYAQGYQDAVDEKRADDESRD